MQEKKEGVVKYNQLLKLLLNIHSSAILIHPHSEILRREHDEGLQTLCITQCLCVLMEHSPKKETYLGRTKQYYFGRYFG